MELNDFLESEVTEFEFNSFHRMPSKYHSFLQTRISGLIDAKYRQEYSVLSAIELELSTGKSIPDVAIYPKIHIDWDAEDEIRMTIAPLLTIEILSPKQALSDLTNKNKLTYFPAGVKSAWIVMPSLRAVVVSLPNGKRKTFEEGSVKDATTGIELSLDDIFES
jgi:Uma2 family endonuclease